MHSGSCRFSFSLSTKTLPAFFRSDGTDFKEELRGCRHHIAVLIIQMNHNKSTHSSGRSAQTERKFVMCDLPSLNYGGTASDAAVSASLVQFEQLSQWTGLDWAVETTDPGRELLLMTYPLPSSPRCRAVTLSQSPLRPRRRPSGWNYFRWAQRSITGSVCAFASSILACHFQLPWSHTTYTSCCSVPYSGESYENKHWKSFKALYETLLNLPLIQSKFGWSYSVY